MKRTLSVFAVLVLAGCGTNARPQQKIPVPGPTSPVAATTKTARPTTHRAVKPSSRPPASVRPVKPSLPKGIPPKPKPAAVYYANCAAARAAGAAPLHRGDPGYRTGLDRDGDGTACE